MSERLEGIAAGARPRRGRRAALTRHTALHNLAHAERAAIIVVGSSHTGHLGRVVPGQHRRAAAARSPVRGRRRPARLRQAAPTPPIRRIGVAYNGSDEATAAVAGAVALARAFDAELEIIGVVAAETYSAPALMGGPSVVELREDIERHVQESLDAVVAGLPEDIKADDACGSPASPPSARASAAPSST